jgi:dTDP-4-dehydrorhamnose reductase
MKVLVIGSNGQLGRCLYDQLKKETHEVVFSSRNEIDITDFKLTKNKISSFGPDILINASAYTAVDKAEQERDIANLVNNLSVSNLAEICQSLNCWLIHVSTDYVFDGKYNEAIHEENVTNPQTVYGKSKLMGEKAIRLKCKKHIIIRTSWVFSEYGNNFLKTMLKIGATKKELSVVSDQIGCPTYAQDIAKIILKIIPKLNSIGVSGIYNYCGLESCSWHQFAIEIFDQAKEINLKTPKIVKAIKSDKYPAVAERPFFSVLDCSKILNTFDVVPSDWRLGIRKTISKL